jgi:hypothetical protein
MKIASALLAIVIFAGANPLKAETSAKGFPLHHEIDGTSRFIFYAVIEGLYEDGLSNEDVAQILMRKEKQSYFHFIYACPICTPTIWALETYRMRPERFYGLKMRGSTFGQGLPEDLKKQLYSEDANQRLIAINTLVQKWMKRRIAAMNLSKSERSVLVKALEQKRRDGMNVLKIFREEKHLAENAPAYVDLEECAVCNGAVGKVMKLPEAK